MSTNHAHVALTLDTTEFRKALHVIDTKGVRRSGRSRGAMIAGYAAIVIGWAYMTWVLGTWLMGPLAANQLVTGLPPVWLMYVTAAATIGAVGFGVTALFSDRRTQTVFLLIGAALALVAFAATLYAGTFDPTVINIRNFVPNTYSGQV